jgi:hypothetical protein
MQRHLVLVVARPAPFEHATQRPAKLVVLDVRRQARLQAATAPRPPQRAA